MSARTTAHLISNADRQSVRPGCTKPAVTGCASMGENCPSVIQSVADLENDIDKENKTLDSAGGCGEEPLNLVG